MNQTDPNVNTALTALSELCKVLGIFLGAHGLASSGVMFWLQIIGAGALIVGPYIWNFYTSIITLAKARAVGVQAGINLTVSGKAVDSTGVVISKFDETATSTPPKAVTLASAAEIVKAFAPAPQTIAKA